MTPNREGKNAETNPALADTLKSGDTPMGNENVAEGEERRVSFADTPLPSISIEGETSEDQKQGQDSQYAHSIYSRSSHQRTSLRAHDAQTAQASVRSIYSKDITYSYIDNRRYSPNYFMPNDTTEQDRQSILHHVFLLLLRNRLTTVPLSSPTKVLDIGTGPGDWAIAIAEDYPDCEVIGVDVSFIQPSAIPHNCFFENYDAEDTAGWTLAPDSVDLVHFRNMKGAFDDWDEIYRRAFEVTKEGGHIELVEFGQQMGFESYFAESSSVHAWFTALRETARLSPKSYSFSFLTKGALLQAGYRNIKEREIEIPIGDWANDDRMRRVSQLWLVSVIKGLEAISLRPLTELIGWTVDEVRKVCKEVGKELIRIAKDKEHVKGFSVNVKILSGRKPYAEELDAASDGGYSTDDQLGAISPEPGVTERRVKKTEEVEGLAQEHMARLQMQDQDT